jgi:hypothetical protein
VIGKFLRSNSKAKVGSRFSCRSALAAQLKEIVTANKPTGTFASVQGLSVTIPDSSYFWSSHGSRYVGFQFDRATGWSKWIENMATFEEMAE